MLSFLVALLPLLASAAPAPAVPTPHAFGKREMRVIIYAGRDGKCLTLAGQPGNGTPVVSGDCNANPTRWDINPGSGSIIVSGTNYALDIGLTPGNNGPLKVWQSYPGAPQQTWYYTDDKRIAQTGGTQCLDEGTNGIQTYQCTTGNTNQIFFTSGGGIPPSSSSSAPPTSSSMTPPPTGGKRIRARAYGNSCLTTQNGELNVGTIVQLSECFTSSSPYYRYQVFQVPSVNMAGPIKIGNNLCLDGGSNPANGGVLKLWTCYEGLFQQTWSVNPSGTLSLSNNQCVNVRLESGPTSFPLYPSVKSMQTWQCSATDPQMLFEIVNA